MFLPYMGMEAVFFNGTEPFEEILNTLTIEGPMRNMVKIAQAVSDYTILYMYIAKKQGQMYIAQGQGQITPRGQNFDCK